MVFFEWNWRGERDVEMVVGWVESVGLVRLYGIEIWLARCTLDLLCFAVSKVSCKGCCLSSWKQFKMVILLYF
jgi:hypothetical protein